MNRLLSLSAVEVAREVTHGELSASEYLEACLERIQEREATVGAWAYVDFRQARSAAIRLDSQRSARPLEGVPIGVKDIIDTVDMPTSYGSCLYADHLPRRDAALISMLRAAGALLIGKTVCTEFAYSSPGKTTNPHDASHTPGGSSSGSAASVADYMAPVSIGTQTAGSIIRPAAFCGVVGFKPTFGAISRAGVLSFSESLDTVGVIARTVADAGLVASVLSRSPAMVLRKSFERPPRFGLCQTHNWHKATGETVDAITDAVNRLRAAGAHVANIELPDVLAGVTDAQLTIMAYEAASALAYERTAHRAELTPALQELLDDGESCGQLDYENAIDVVHASSIALEAAFKECDILLTPSTIGSAPRGLQSTGDPLFNRMWTALRVPSIHVPTMTGSSGLPMGVQLIAQPRHDAQLLAGAEWLEACVTGTRAYKETDGGKGHCGDRRHVSA